jgi:hypothetical protein
MSEKICSRCYMIVDLNNFHRNSKSIDGRGSYCKSCVYAYQKQREENIKIQKMMDKLANPQPVVESITHKVCTKCHMLRILSDFKVDTRRRYQVGSRCKRCELIVEKERYYLSIIKKKLANTEIEKIEDVSEYINDDNDIFIN